MIELKDADRPSTTPPIISLRLACTVLLLAGLLVLAHGCHGDEDNELWAWRAARPTNATSPLNLAVGGLVIKSGDDLLSRCSH